MDKFKIILNEYSDIINHLEIDSSWLDEIYQADDIKLILITLKL
jgi:hypothetical protein